jgi:hypothetical protein
MGEPYVIRLLVKDGDPDGVRTATRQNWNGKAVAFPRVDWPRVQRRSEFRKTGVYVLVGPTEGAQDGVPTVYIGQSDAVGDRIASHYTQKEFWDFCVAVIAEGTPLNSAQARWLEHVLVDRAAVLGNCHLDNSTSPKQPPLAEWDLVETKGFYKKILEVLPLVGVNAFDEGALAVKPAVAALVSPAKAAIYDTIVVPANEDGFNKVFLGEDCWYAIRIGSEMLDRIKYIAAYQTAPISAVTHYAPVARIERIEGTGKYQLYFAEPAKELEPIPFGDAKTGSMQGPRYTTHDRLLKASCIRELFEV